MALLQAKSNRLLTTATVAIVIVIFGSNIARQLLTLPGENDMLFWPMIGLAVGLLLATERHYWFWLVLLFFVIDAPFALRFEFAPRAMLDILEYLALYAIVITGCWLLNRRYPAGILLHRINPDLRDFVFTAVGISFLTSFFDPLQAALGIGQPAGIEAWQQWFTFNLMSIVVVAPFILAWTSLPPRPFEFGDRARVLELGFLIITLALILGLGLHGPPSSHQSTFDFVWLPVMWAVFRFDLRIVTSVVFATASYVSIVLSSTVGLFDVTTSRWPTESLIATAYMAISVLVALSVYALVEQARQQMAQSKEAKDAADRLMQATGSFFWIFDVGKGGYQHMSDTETGFWTDNLGMRTGADDWLRFVHADERDAVNHMWHGMRNGTLMEPFDITFRLVNDDGDVRWDQHIGIPILDPDGTVDRYVGMIFDITNEESLRLEERHLRDVLHESDKLNTVGTLAAGLAHDWNNLLLVLSMEADRLREIPNQDTSLLESIKVLDQVVEEGQKTTNELLSLARRDVEPSVPTNLHREVHKAAELLARALPNRISLRTNYVLDSALIVNCKVSHLHQIVMNLGLNARDAIGDGAGTISITVDGPEDGEILDKPCRVARLSVVDDGSGMPPDVVDQIFEPLFSTKLDSGGTGLGLSVVKSFVTEMGGAIDVDSTEGDGTTVTISMPVAVTEDKS